MNESNVWQLTHLVNGQCNGEVLTYPSKPTITTTTTTAGIAICAHSTVPIKAPDWLTLLNVREKIVMPNNSSEAESGSEECHSLEAMKLGPSPHHICVLLLDHKSWNPDLCIVHCHFHSLSVAIQSRLLCQAKHSIISWGLKCNSLSFV